MNILVSACLLGQNCKYDGGNNLVEDIESILKQHTIIPFCPEQAGGLPTPRNPVEIVGKNVIDYDGIDYTDEFCKGARETLNMAKRFGITLAILKSKSPSCGKDIIYDGTFTHNLTSGNGITAQLLMDNNITVITEKQLDEDFFKKL